MKIRFTSNKDFYPFLIVFICIWIIILIRVFTVPLIYDEIHTKWIYMIEYNPLPYMGYVDANNHFLNSLIGGLLIRITGSDADWVIRLASVMAFPIYFWSVYAFRKFFQNKSSFYLFMTVFCGTMFLLDYFNLARGYGLSLAFLMLGLQQSFDYIYEPTNKKPYIISIAWFLAVFSNLTLIPFALIGLGYMLLFQMKNKKYWSMIPLLLILMPLLYLIQYSLHLKEIGKLYYGGQDGFYENTVNSLANYVWEPWTYLNWIFVSLVFILSVIVLIKVLAKNWNVFDLKLIFPGLLILAVANILLQHYLLGINFPEDRSALYLLVFFFGALVFTIDYFKIPYVSYSLIFPSLILFGFKVNFTHSTFWSYEHFDKELLTKMEPEIQGAPPTTGGRFWTMDNELTRTTNIPGRVLQDVHFPQDTILDYLVLNKGVLPEVHSGLYERIHEDPISKIQLFKRKNFLNRQFVESKEFNFDTVEEFIGVFNRIPEGTYIIRVKGHLEEMNIHRRPLLVVSLDDNKKSQNYTYLAYNFVESLPINESKQIHFDLTFGVNQFPEANSLSVYFWNTKKFQLKGKGIVEIYEIVN